MAKPKTTTASAKNTTGDFGFQAELWLTADRLRNNIDAAECKHVVLALGAAENRSKDILGRVYEYFLTQFASAEGKNGGQFYTPRCVVRVLVERLTPYNGRVYDPRCGSAGMFVQSKKFVEEHGGRIGDIAVYGQEPNSTTRRLAMMNLAIRGIEGDLGPEHADTFHRDLHKDLKADDVLANGSMFFNQSGEASSDTTFLMRSCDPALRATT